MSSAGFRTRWSRRLGALRTLGVTVSSRLIADGVDWANGPENKRTIRVSVLMFSVVPWLVLGDELRAKSATTGTQAPEDDPLSDPHSIGDASSQSFYLADASKLLIAKASPHFGSDGVDADGEYG